LSATFAFEEFCTNALVRSAVERQFEVIGEALSQLAKVDEALASRVPDHRRIIAFRNVLIHGYAALDHKLVWRVIQEDLPALLSSVEELLGALGVPTDG
jgi:uncharacterized protein with HEPN domain